MPSPPRTKRKRRSTKYHRARLRKFFFTHGPNRLSGGTMKRRHLASDVVVREIDVAIRGWPATFDGLRIGHVSDFHLGELMPLDRALAIIEQLNEQGPDLIACTGDVVDLRNDGAMPLLKSLAATDAPLGALLAMGNHDELDSVDVLTAMASEAGLTVLRNETVEIAHNGERLIVAGINWARTLAACRRQVDATCDGSAHILLSHNPKGFRRAAELGIPLTLSGHTHGGQIAFKNRPKTNLAFSHRHSAGLYKNRYSRLFVTTGIGAWFPLRVNCPAEIAMITVRRDDG